MLKPSALSTQARNNVVRWADTVSQGVTQWLAIGLVLLVLGIAGELFVTAIPAIQSFGLGFLLSSEWNPVQDVYGIAPQIYGTLMSALLAIALTIPLGLGIAILLHETIFPRVIRVPLSFLIELLAAIPSVVYGLWGIFILIPTLMPVFRWLHQHLGWLPLFNTVPGQRGLLPTILVLTLMMLPIVVALSRDALAALPAELREGAAALGATRWEIILKILLPASLSGIVGATVLALGRALGETMAAVMLIGNANQIQSSILAPASTIAALIANQFSEARGLQVSALLYAALALMGLTLIINVVATLLIDSFQVIQQRLQTYRRYASLVLTRAALSNPILKAADHRMHPTIGSAPSTSAPATSAPATSGGAMRKPQQLWRPASMRRSLTSVLLTGWCLFAMTITLLAIGSLFVSLISQGIARFDEAAFTELPPPPLDLGGGFRNAITGTVLMVGIGAGLSAPLGIGVAIYLVEFGRGHRLSQWVRFFNGVLSGVPSILCGLFAYSLVVLTTGTFSVIAGGVALAVVMVPMIVRAAEEGLKAVAPELREGAIALGATPTQTVGAIVLPTAAPAIATGVVLSIARATGETAPLLFTALFSQFGFNGGWNPIASLSVLIYNFALSPYPNHQALAWTASLVIVGLILSVSITARYITRDRLH